MSYWISLIAAFGFGSIVAAVVGGLGAKAVAISNHRQNWINALRDDIAEFLKEVDVLHFRVGKMLRSGDTDDLEKQQDARASAMLVYRRVRMRLNMTEIPSIQLAGTLEDLMTIDSSVANPDRMEAAIKASCIVLKREWEVTKYGIFAGPILWLKRTTTEGLMIQKLRLDVIAIGISLIAALFTGLQWWEAREQRQLANDATVEVDVDSEPGRSKRGIFVRNAGPGVAHIKTVKYFVDGKLVSDINEPFDRVARLDSGRLAEVGIEGSTISPGERQQILRFDASKSEQDRAEEFFESHLNVAVAYCSGGGRCATACADEKKCDADKTVAKQ